MDIKGQDKVFVGADLGGTKIKLAVTDQYKIINTKTIESRSKQEFRSQLPEIKVAVDQIMRENNISSDQLQGIGLAFPSIVDNKKKQILSQYVKFSDADNMDLPQWAMDCWGVPLALENDARAALVGEWQFGAGKDYNNIVMITLGTGVGSAVLLDGKLIRGAHHVGGNLGGHTIININGTPCNCGSRGCVETEASGWIVHEKYINHTLMQQSELRKEARINYKSVFSLAEKGDKMAIEIKDHTLKAWAINALNFVHHFDPEIVIIGGGIMHSGDKIIPYIQQFIDRYAWQPGGTIKVLGASQIDFAGALGMAILAQDDI